MALEADAAALEADAVAAQLSALQSLLVAASESVCPGHADVFARPKEAVRATTTSETGPDLQCHAPATIWRRLRARAPAAEPVLLTTTSEFGTRSERAYGSAAELSAAILAALPPEEASRRLADARVRADDGCLLLTTQLHWRRQRTAGLLHCTLCGAFCAGERGLRDHQQVKHRESYGAAKAAVAAATGALIPYAPPASVAGRLSELWAERAGAAARARSALPPALAAARDGDLAALRSCGDVTAVDRHGSNALMWAAGGGHLDVARWLLEAQGVAVDAANKDQRTALMWAAKNGRAAVAAYLLDEAGADPTCRMKDDSSAFDWAVLSGDVPTMELLAAHPRVDIQALNKFGCAAVQWAAAAGNVTTLRWLQEKGLSLAHVNAARHGAIVKAAWKGHSDALEWLLHADDGPRLVEQLAMRDLEGRTVAELVRLNGQHEVAAWLEPLIAAEEGKAA